MSAAPSSPGKLVLAGGVAKCVGSSLAEVDGAVYFLRLVMASVEGRLDMTLSFALLVVELNAVVPVQWLAASSTAAANAASPDKRRKIALICMWRTPQLIFPTVRKKRSDMECGPGLRFRSLSLFATL